MREIINAAPNTPSNDTIMIFSNSASLSSSSFVETTGFGGGDGASLILGVGLTIWAGGGISFSSCWGALSHLCFYLLTSSTSGS